MTLTPGHTPAAAAAAAATIPVLPGLPAGIDSTDVVVQMVRRAASPGFESWWRKAENVGFCANPIHLLGTDTFGRAHQVLSRCNNRRAVACPSCSDLYARDTWQLLHAGCTADTTTCRPPRRSPASVRHPDRTVSGPCTTRTTDTVAGRRCHDPGRSGYRRCRHGKNRCVVPPSTAMMMRGWVNRYAKTATTTWARLLPGTPRAVAALHHHLRRLLDSHQRAWVKPPECSPQLCESRRMQRRAIPHFTPSSA
jgi:hypothetical protein